MNIQLDLSDLRAGRGTNGPAATVATGVIKVPPVQNGDTATPKSIEIAQLPMVRKSGPMALIFDRMDSNANGVLTRAELISYRLKPMVTEMVIPAPAMPEETLRNVARAAEALLAGQAEGDAEAQDGAEMPEIIGSGSDTASNGSDAPALPVFAPTVGPDAPGSYVPASLPESIVIAKTVDAPAPIAA